MARPIKSHRETVKADKSAGETFERVDHDLLEPVNGGHVRRIVFEGREPTADRVVEAPANRERVYRPRHVAPMDDIEFEVDHLGKSRPAPRAPANAHTETIYTTDQGGSVREAYSPSERGPKRVLYTTVNKGTHQEDKRFSVSDVDRIIAGVSLEPEVEVVRTEKTSFISRKRKVVEKVPVNKASKAEATFEFVAEPKGKPVRKAAAKPKAKPKAKPAAKPAAKPVAKPAPVEVNEEASGYRPQCEAVTKGALQCRNSSRGGSKYCGAHKGYHAKSFDSVLASKDTLPAHEGAEDTAPGEAGKKGGEFQPQCAAYTKDGMQCKNSSRTSSKYCGSHKKYRAPSKEAMLKQMDTKPRWANAPDTLPNVK